VSLAAALQRVETLQSLLAGSLPPAPGEQAVAPAEGFAASLQRALSRSRSARPFPYAEQVEAAARRYGVDPALVRAVIEIESGYDPRATSPAGAAGLMQLMPATARSLGVSDPYDPAQSIDAGTRYLAAQLGRFGDIGLALAAYNAGPAAVERAGGVPANGGTPAYVARALARYRELTGADAAEEGP
jgi:soluble lytic murein transglycosylase-like protein